MSDAFACAKGLVSGELEFFGVAVVFPAQEDGEVVAGDEVFHGGGCGGGA